MSPPCLSLLRSLVARSGFASLVVLLFLSGLGAADVQAASQPPQRLQVTDPFIEMRTGPGRGYPVFFVVERNEWIEIELRHTDWFKVRSAGGKQGWVQRAQLESTLTEAGSRKTFRDVVVDDFLRRRLELGASWGRFRSEPMLKVWSAYRFTETLNVEGTVGQVQGVFSSTNFWHINLASEPWADRRISPFFGVGFGRFRNIPNASLVGAVNTNSNLANASVGARWYLTDRFVARVDYTLYTAFLSDSSTTQFRAATAGLSFFF